MNNIILNFINKQQFALANIYYSNLLNNTEPNSGIVNDGALLIDIQPDNMKVDVKYLTLDMVPLEQDIRERLSQMIKYNNDGKILPKRDGKDIQVINLEPFPENMKISIPDYMLYYIILDRSNSIKKYYIMEGVVEAFNICNTKHAQFVFRTEVDAKVPYNENIDTDKTVFRNCWNIKNTETGTNFLKYCEKCLNSETEFSNFRRNPHFTNVVITYDKKYGAACLDVIKQNWSGDIGTIIKKDCKIGGAVLCDYTDFNGAVNSIKYLKTTIEIMKHFGNNMFDNANIVEIGQGYGGLCNIIQNMSKISSYTMIDDPIVSKLAHKYLNGVQNDKLIFNPLISNLLPSYNLLISEYGLCEMDDRGVDWYFSMIVRRCENVYLAMNIWNNHTKTRFINKLGIIFNKIEEYPEYPATRWNNYVIICKENMLLNSTQYNKDI